MNLPSQARAATAAAGGAGSGIVEPSAMMGVLCWIRTTEQHPRGRSPTGKREQASRSSQRTRWWARVKCRGWVPRLGPRRQKKCFPPVSELVPPRSARCSILPQDQSWDGCHRSIEASTPLPGGDVRWIRNRSTRMF